MDILMINGTNFSDYIAHNGYSVSKTHTVSESRDINGNLNIDIINKKIKISCQFIPMNGTQLQSFLQAIEPYVVQLHYYDPETGSMSKEPITAYVGDPEFNYYWIPQQGEKLINGFSVNFIEC